MNSTAARLLVLDEAKPLVLFVMVSAADLAAMVLTGETLARQTDVTSVETLRVARGISLRTMLIDLGVIMVELLNAWVAVPKKSLEKGPAK